MNKRTGRKKYSQHLELSMILPQQFIMICRLLQVDPQKVLFQFMTNLGQEGYSSGEEPQTCAKDYFLSCGYGQELYTYGEIEQMFEELRTIGALWPKGAKMRLVNIHREWRKNYYRYWYRKWFGRIGRM